MTAMIVDPHEGLRAFGAPEDKAQARPERWPITSAAWMRSMTKLAALEGPVTMVKWITGATFAGVLALILRTFMGG